MANDIEYEVVWQSIVHRILRAKAQQRGDMPELRLEQTTGRDTLTGAPIWEDTHLGIKVHGKRYDAFNFLLDLAQHLEGRDNWRGVDAK